MGKLIRLELYSTDPLFQIPSFPALTIYGQTSSRIRVTMSCSSVMHTSRPLSDPMDLESQTREFSRAGLY